MGSEKGLRIDKFFSGEKDPAECIEWEKRTASIKGSDGAGVFEQKNVEFPKSWSQTATNIVAQKYFRGKPGSKEREYSVKQLVSRVADTITREGAKAEYFDGEESTKNFNHELKYLLYNQMAAFNSPVWFNVGMVEKPQSSACFINSVEDSMESILELAKTEGMLFKHGSGTGSNLSKLRSSRESLSVGGIASGPVSFMKGFDAFAGVIKSGGATRRAAKMVILNADHPDIVEFIQCKEKEEKKAWALIDAGYDGSFNGEAYASVQFQNANNSVRVTDDFMRSVTMDEGWKTREVTTGKVADIHKASDLLMDIAKAVHVCGDPGMQFDTTVNKWHTTPNSGRINGSNPCCLPGNTLVVTELGNISIGALYEMQLNGKALPKAKSYDEQGDYVTYKQIKKVWIAGKTRKLIELDLGSIIIRCTPEHRFVTGAYGCKWTPAQEMEDVNSERRSDFDIFRTVDAMAVLEGESCCFLNEKKELAVNDVEVFDLEVEDLHNFCVTSLGSHEAIIAHNSEFMYLDNTSCNLASLNLMRFRAMDDSLDVEAFKNAVRILILAQEILVGFSSYPTEKIAKNSRDFRPLGLGYANLGAFLMCNGMPYDSDMGRQEAALITSLMCAEAYKASAEIASKVGAFQGFELNRGPMLKVIQMHRQASADLDSVGIDTPLHMAALDSWSEALKLGTEHGFRNSQVTVLAPTGTIGFMMDCDTTGVEPDIALVKYKSLSGGGSLKLVNTMIGDALGKLGYHSSQVLDILNYVEANDTIEGAPHLQENHLPIFDCAFKPRNGKRSIHWLGHLRMVAAVQPFLSGAVSKTINCPTDVSVEEIYNAYIDAWRMGLKAVAFYRDGSKRIQPLSTKKEEKAVLSVAPSQQRKRLQDERQSITHKFSIAGHEGYLTVGMYEDGRPGELFIVMSKEGSTVSGLMNTVAEATSIALQYGVPLRTLVTKFSHSRFEPSGFTTNPDLPVAKSVVDYVFRWLEMKFLKSACVPCQQKAIPMVEPTQQEDIFLQQADAPPCHTCGSITVRSGTCYKCFNCGSTTGCS